MNLAKFGILKFGVGAFGVDSVPSPPLLGSAKFGILKFGVGAFGVDTVAPLNKFQIAWWARKKLGKPEWPDPLGVYGIYRVRSIKGTQRTEKMPFYKPANPRTPAQQANRQKFADAMLAWKNLTELEKERYNEEAKSKMLFGWNVFIKEYFAMH